MTTAIEEIKRANGVGAPFIAVRTQDQQGLVKTIFTEYENANEPVLRWNSISGLRPLNKTGEAKALKFLNMVATQDGQSEATAAAALATFHNMLGVVREEKLSQQEIKEAEKKPGLNDLLIIIENGHKFMSELDHIQALMNLRDYFSTSTRSVIFIGPDFQFPPELAQDFCVIDEALPTPEVIKAQATEIYKQHEVDTKKGELIKTASEAFRGLSRFSVTQAIYLSMRKDDKGKYGVEESDLWARKREMINSIDGLSMEQWGPTLDDVGGLESVKEFIKQLFNGEDPPSAIIFVDEVEKMIAGAGGTSGVGDSSGTSQDALKVFLDAFERYGWRGQGGVGPAGTGKTFFALCVASTYKRPMLSIDFGAAKGGIVSESERKIRAVMRTVYAIAGNGAYFFSTSNRLNSVPPELRRRLWNFGGVWFYDLPTVEERISLGKLQTAKFKVTDGADFWKKAVGWSAANIRDCCRIAHDLKISIKDAAKWIVPAARQDAEGLRNIRKLADGKFLSASYEGTYAMQEEAEIVEETNTNVRKIK